MSRIVLFDPKLTLRFNFSNFEVESFHFQNFRDVSMRKVKQQPLGSLNLLKFCEIMSER